MLAPASDLDPIIYFIPIWTNVPQIFKLKSNTSWLSDDLLIKPLYTNNNITLGVVGNYVFVFFSDILFLVHVCVCVCVCVRAHTCTLCSMFLYQRNSHHFTFNCSSMRLVIPGIVYDQFLSIINHTFGGKMLDD